MTKEQKEEIRDILQSILTHVTEARCLSEELENLSRSVDVDDEVLEAECYDWACGLEEVERRVEEYMAEYYSEEVDEVNA
jgi:hypothetical protein